MRGSAATIAHTPWNCTIRKNWNFIFHAERTENLLEVILQSKGMFSVMQVKGNLLYRNVNARSCSVPSLVSETALLLNISQSQLICGFMRQNSLGTWISPPHVQKNPWLRINQNQTKWHISTPQIFQTALINRNLFIFNLGPISKYFWIETQPCQCLAAQWMCVPLILLTGFSSGCPTIGTEPGMMRKVLYFPSNVSVAQARPAPSRQRWRGLWSNWMRRY